MIETSFGIRANARVEVIIDGTHLHAASRAAGFDIDFNRLRKLLFTEYDCRRISFLLKTPYDDNGEIAIAQVARLLDFLRFNGYTTIVGESKGWIDQSTGRRVLRQGVEVALACMIFKASRHVDEIILFAGSDELVLPVETCMDFGARVTVVSTSTPTSMISQELRGTADLFIELASLKEKIVRSGGDRDPNLSITDRVATQAEDPQVERRDDTSLGNRVRVTSRSSAR